MRKVTYPTRILLNEIPLEGRTFYFSADSAELTESLADLIGSHPYQVELSLKPLGNIYEITGKIEAHRNLTCSRCGRDTVKPFEDRFTEMIVLEDERPRKTRAGHVSHEGAGTAGPFCNYVRSNNFDLAAFVREHIASDEDYLFQCGAEDCEDLLQKFQSQGGEDLGQMDTHKPFEILKNLKSLM